MDNFYTVTPIAAYEDHRGAVVYPFRDLGVDPGEMKSMHVASIAPGEVRGNHLHPHQEEYVLVTGVEVSAILISMDGERAVIAIGPEPMLVTIRPGVAHAFKNEGDFPCFLTCWYSGGGENVVSVPRNVVD
ncbi:MAG: cupin domain-containing protein [Nitrospinota bacterium]|nr:cupin domain-containing protein [Nitrospinota bacterium]MDH5678984.1 cupin domain-containing protein [Nitrospinota bacterium]MDH5757369.1 cupin domain-containing protein [Nitrospinota bacterium]